MAFSCNPDCTREVAEQQGKPSVSRERKPNTQNMQSVKTLKLPWSYSNYQHFSWFHNHIILPCSYLRIEEIFSTFFLFDLLGLPHFLIPCFIGLFGHEAWCWNMTTYYRDDLTQLNQISTQQIWFRSPGGQERGSSTPTYIYRYGS